MTDESININKSNNSEPAAIEPGDLVLLVTPDDKRFLLRIEPGRIQHTHRGQYHHETLVGERFGNTVQSQIGHAALLLEPSVGDMMRHLKRGTQIVYAKDAAHLVHRLNLSAGSTVIEAGTGSGALTMALAHAVAPGGRVYTYEARTEIHKLAEQNLRRFGLLPHVEMFNATIADGFQQTNVDALFLDVREPWRFLDHVHAALKPGGFFASLLPTTNQVSTLLAELEEKSFAMVEVEELLQRRYKPVPDRLRPEDDMIGHTGFLLFARTISGSIDPSRWLSRDRKRYRARQKAKERIEAEEERRAAEIASGGPKYPRMPLP